MVTKARWVGRGVRLRSQRLTPKFARVAQFGRARTLAAGAPTNTLCAAPGKSFATQVAEQRFKVCGFRKLRPLSSKPLPCFSIDRPHGLIRVPPAFLGFAAISVCGSL